MEFVELRARLEKITADYDPAAHTRCLLDPLRDIIFQQRVKFISYEQIAGILATCGLRTSREAVRCFCRRNFTKAAIEQARTQARRAAASEPPPQLPGLAPLLTSASSTPPTASGFAKRGPRIARDVF